MGGYAGTGAAQVGATCRGRKEKRTIGFWLVYYTRSCSCSQSGNAQWVPDIPTFPKKANVLSRPCPHYLLATTMTSPGAEESASVFERLQGFVADNKRAILIGTAAALLAVGGVAAYQYHVASSSAGAGGSRRRARKDGDVEKGEGEGKKRKSKKKTTVKDKDGPILEERDPVKPASGCVLFSPF